MSLRNSGRKIKAVLAIFLLPLLAGDVSAPGQWLRSEPEILSAGSQRDLKAFFRALNYDWDTVGSGVPSFILTSFPADLERIPEIEERKKIFFLSLLPMVLLVNEEIEQQRERLLSLLEAHDRGEDLDANQRQWIVTIAAEYQIETDPLTHPLARRMLLLRLDVVPPPLALAQAASESGYGTSRFARTGNNLFGEWTFLPGSGMVPDARPQGEIYELRRFPTLYESVRSYIRNLNTNRAYGLFRLQRERLRSEGRPLQGYELAQGLGNYSVRGAAYVGDIQSIIKRNRLTLLSEATLRPDSSSLRESRSETSPGSASAGQTASIPTLRTR